MQKSGTVVLLVMLVLIAASAASRSDPSQDGTSSATVEQLEKRLNELQIMLDSHEKRLAKLEETLRPLIGLAGASEEAGESPGGNAFDSPAMSLVEVNGTNKRYQASDAPSGRYNDYIWYDATYTSRLKKKTRSIKGIMQFCDLFGEPKFQIRVTIDDPIEPGKQFTTTGVGFEYNQFLDTHNWMRATALVDMTFKFQVEAVLYADGTREDF